MSKPNKISSIIPKQRAEIDILLEKIVNNW
jgi:hypothetical protein